MSIANLEYRGLLNSDNQIIQRPIAFNRYQEISIYEVNFNNVSDTGTSVNGTLGVTINQGTTGYLPSRDNVGIRILENGVYSVLLQVRNLDTMTGLSKYLFTVKTENGQIFNQGVLDLYNKGIINPNERVAFLQTYLDVNLAPYYITFEAQNIYTSIPITPKNFGAFFTIIRVK